MKTNFRTLDFIYQDVQIHFLVNPLEKNVMINATEMAKGFSKRIDVFLKADHTQNFIKELENYHASFPPNGGNENDEFPPNGGNSEFKIVVSKGHMGTYMCEPLALKFAAWLEPKFELWIYQRIQDVIFGNYKKHWEAHARQEYAKQKMEAFKREILQEPTPEKVEQYFRFEKDYQNAKYDKTKAIQNQLKLFNNF